MERTSVRSVSRQSRLKVTSVASEPLSVILQVRFTPGLIALVPTPVTPLPSSSTPSLGQVETVLLSTTPTKPVLSHSLIEEKRSVLTGRGDLPYTGVSRRTGVAIG